MNDGRRAELGPTRAARALIGGLAAALLAGCGEDSADAPSTEVDAAIQEEIETVDDTVDTFLEGIELGNRTQIQRVISPGGIEAWLVYEDTVPLIAMEVGFMGGARLDPPGKEGLAYMLSGLLDEGAGDLDSQAFQTRLEDLAIRLSFDASRDGFYGSLKTLAENRVEAFRLLRLALSEPRFDAEPVERIRSQILVRLNRDLGDPDTMAQLKLFETIFADHPYGHPLRGNPDSIAGIDAGDLRAFLGSRIAKENLKIAVVGSIDADELALVLDDVFSALPEKTTGIDVATAEIPDQGQIIVVERDQPQSVAFFGWPGIDRDDPDFYAAYVMNYILGGGGFSSRLTEEVREKRGLAYGVSTFLAPYDFGATFLGSVATENERVSQSLDIIRSEIARMADEGVSEEELAGAKTYLTGSYLLRFDSNSSIANELLGYQMTRRDIDYINIRNQLIEAVTKEDIDRAARRLLDAEALTVVVVGKPANLGASE